MDGKAGIKMPWGLGDRMPGQVEPGEGSHKKNTTLATGSYHACMYRVDVTHHESMSD